MVELKVRIKRRVFYSIKDTTSTHFTDMRKSGYFNYYFFAHFSLKTTTTAAAEGEEEEAPPPLPTTTTNTAISYSATKLPSFDS